VNLVQECSFTATLKHPLPIGAGPIGTRIYHEVADGKVSGDRLRGTVLGGGEWALVGPDGFLRIDVRPQFATVRVGQHYVLHRRGSRPSGARRRMSRLAAGVVFAHRTRRCS
jgi:hypothetical protein